MFTVMILINPFTSSQRKKGSRREEKWKRKIKARMKRLHLLKLEKKAKM